MHTQTEMTFEAMIALSLSQFVRDQNTDLGRRLVISRQRAISGLEECLTDAVTSIDDAAISVVLSLLSIDAGLQKTKHVQAHLVGLREMIRRRGGLDHLGFNGALARRALVTEAVLRSALVP